MRTTAGTEDGASWGLDFDRESNRFGDIMTVSPLPSLKSILVSVSHDDDATLTSMRPGWL